MALGMGTRTHTCMHTHTYLHERDFRKPGMWPVCAWLKNQRNILLEIKEALIGKHNLKPLLAVHKRSIDSLRLMGSKPVIILQVHPYNIRVINAHPQLREITKISYLSWV